VYGRHVTKNGNLNLDFGDEIQHAMRIKELKDRSVMGAHLHCVSCSVAHAWRVCEGRRQARLRAPPGTAPSGREQPCPAAFAQRRWDCCALRIRQASQSGARAHRRGTSFGSSMPTWAMIIRCVRVTNSGGTCSRALHDGMRGRGSGDGRSSVVSHWHCKASMWMQTDTDVCRWPSAPWAVPDRAACSSGL